MSSEVWYLEALRRRKQQDENIALAEAEAEVERLEQLQDQIKRLKEAIQPVLAAYRSGPSHITEDQITKAWEEFDRA